MRGRAAPVVITDELPEATEAGTASEVIMRPISAEWPEARLCAKIDTWRRLGIPWASIAAELGLPDKYAAKRKRRELEHRVRLRQLAG